jgi:hypothetical protein
LDDRNNGLPRKTEPGFEADAAGGVAAGHDSPDAGDMPFWLKEPAAQASVGGGWKQTMLLWGGSLLTLAVVFAGAMWLFDEHGNERAMATVAHAQLPAAPAAPAQPAAPRPNGGSLPPLVLLTPAPDPAKPAAAKVIAPAPVAVAPVPAVAKVQTKPPAARIAGKAPPPKPAAKSLLAKAPSKALPPAPHKALLAKSPAPAPKAKARLVAGARKPLVLAKHTPMTPKVKPKVVAGMVLPPAREREPLRAQAAVQPHRCQPGELARECAARE